MRWRVVLALGGILLAPLLAYLGNELANRGTFSAIGELFTLRPGVVVLGYIMYLAVFIFLYALIGRAKIACALYGLLFFALSVAQHFKMEFRGEPLMLRDIFSAGAAAGILDRFEIILPQSLIIGIALFVAQIILGFIMPRRVPVNMHARLISLAVLGIFAVEGTKVLWRNGTTNVFGAYYVHWSPTQNYDWNGMALSLLFTGQSFILEEPKGYTREAAKAALSSADDSDYAPKATGLTKKPHIIAIMGEAYADIRKMNDNVLFNDDPFAPMENVGGNLTGGDLVVSIFGGSTAVTEFEFLTGYSQRFFPSGTVAYQHYFADARSSLVSTLKREGYDTVALHPNDGNYWARRTAYDSMGFDRFIDYAGFTTPRYRNGLMTDAAMLDVMKQKFRDRDSDKPMFMFAVTIENHSPYDRDAGDPPYDFDASGIENLSDAQRLSVNTHTTGVKHTSEMVAELIEFLRAEGEPVMVVFFGDHQPRVDIPQIAVKTDAVNDAEDLLLKNEFTAPYYVWTSYDVDLSEWPEIFSPNLMAPYVLQTAGLEAPRYLRKVYDVSQRLQGFTANFLLGEDGTLRVRYDENAVEAKEIGDLMLLQYDTLFGEGYTDNRLWNVPKPE